MPSDTDQSKPAVLIFKSQLLPYSETFIYEQARQLNNYRPIYTGLRRVAGIDLPADSTVALNHGGIVGRFREYLYAMTGFAPGFLRRLKSYKPSLIHAQFGPNGVLALPISQRLDVPMIVTYLGFDATMAYSELRKVGYGGWLYVARIDRLKAAPVRFLAFSHYIADRLIKQGFPSDRITVHYTGIDTALFSPDPQVQREKFVLFVGRFVDKKGCEYLIRAMADVQKEHPDAKLVLAGDGPLRPQLTALVDSLRVNATFLGVQSHDQIRQLMLRAWVMCVPSVTAANGDAEGLGMVFLEAQACGLPVVTTRHGPIPEVVEHEVTGFLAEERDPVGLATSISRLFSDHDLHKSIAEAARKSVCHKFDINIQTAKLEAIFDETIRAHRSRRAQ